MLLTTAPLLLALSVSPIAQRIAEPVPAELVITTTALPPLGSSISTDQLSILASSVAETTAWIQEAGLAFGKLWQTKSSSIEPFIAPSHDWLDPAAIQA